MKDLTSLKNKDSAIIKGFSQYCNVVMRDRLLDLGFVPGTRVFRIRTSPLGDPVAYSVHNTVISLRHEDAEVILIENNE